MTTPAQLLPRSSFLVTNTCRAASRTKILQPASTRPFSRSARRRAEEYDDKEGKPVRLLSEVDYKGRPLPPKPDPRKDKWANMWYPRTRLVLGTILIAVVIYDMVRFVTFSSQFS